jgi:hypothetical protein
MATPRATWTIDPAHSSVEFSLDYMGFSAYRTGLRALGGSPGPLLALGCDDVLPCATCGTVRERSASAS